MSLADVWNASNWGIKLGAWGVEVRDPLFYRALLAEWLGTTGLVLFILLVRSLDGSPLRDVLA